MKQTLFVVCVVMLLLLCGLFLSNFNDIIMYNYFLFFYVRTFLEQTAKGRFSYLVFYFHEKYQPSARCAPYRISVLSRYNLTV